MPESRNNRPRSLGLAVGILGCVALAGAIFARVAAPAAPAHKAASAPATSAPITRYQVPVTSSQPSKGPADAAVTIVEWCTFELAQCKAADAVMNTVLAQYGDKVRWVYRAFSQPSSHWHKSHEFAQLAYERAGKFWEAKELLQDSPRAPARADLERIATTLGLDWTNTSSALDDHSFAGHVVADRMFAVMFDVGDAPAFFVNGRRLSGAATLPAFKALIDDEIANAAQLVARGVPKEQVYAELTKNGLWKRVSMRRN